MAKWKPVLQHDAWELLDLLEAAIDKYTYIGNEPEWVKNGRALFERLRVKEEKSPTLRLGNGDVVVAGYDGVYVVDGKDLGAFQRPKNHAEAKQTTREKEDVCPRCNQLRSKTLETHISERRCPGCGGYIERKQTTREKVDIELGHMAEPSCKRLAGAIRDLADAIDELRER